MRVSKMSAGQNSNQAKLGFYPTDLSVVEMEMKLVDFSDLSNRDISINICDLTGGIGEQLDKMHSYLDNINVNNKCYYNELNVDRYKSCVSSFPYMNHLNVDANLLKIGAKKNNTIDKRVFGVIRNNPPYGYDSNSVVNVRLEKKFFDINTNFDMPGTIHFFEVPIGQLDKQLLNPVSYRYHIKAFKFPDEEFKKYKQVCLILKRKPKNKINSIEVDEILKSVENNTMLSLDQVNSPVFSLTYREMKNQKDIYYYRKNGVTDITIQNGAEQVWGEISKYKAKGSKNNNFIKEKPIIELLQGHISSLLASGRYNGIMGNYLIIGGSNKVVKEKVDFDDDGKQIITETEVLQPFFEITNKNGDIMYKDF